MRVQDNLKWRIHSNSINIKNSPKFELTSNKNTYWVSSFEVLLLLCYGPSNVLSVFVSLKPLLRRCCGAWNAYHKRFYLQNKATQTNTGRRTAAWNEPTPPSVWPTVRFVTDGHIKPNWWDFDGTSTMCACWNLNSGVAIMAQSPTFLLFLCIFIRGGKTWNMYIELPRVHLHKFRATQPELREKPNWGSNRTR